MRFEELENKLQGLIDDPDEVEVESWSEEKKTAPKQAKKLSVGMETPIQGQDKVEMVVFALILAIVVTLVIVVTFFATKKLLNKNKEQNKTNKSEIIVAIDEAEYVDEVIGYRLRYQQDWVLTKSSDDWLRLVPKSSGNNSMRVDVLLLQVKAFLNRTKYSVIGKKMKEYCDHFTGLETLECSDKLVEVTDFVTDSGVFGKKAMVDANTSNGEKVTLTVYFYEVDNDSYDVVALVAINDASLPTAESIAKRFEELP